MGPERVALEKKMQVSIHKGLESKSQLFWPLLWRILTCCSLARFGVLRRCGSAEDPWCAQLRH